MEAIQVSGRSCKVDQLPKGLYKGEPTHDLVAPKGFHFEGCGHHSIPCYGLRDVKDRAGGETLIACDDDCDCHFDDAEA